MNNSFGEILKKWRKTRRYSQLQMAEEVGISSRHISFLETGRSSPSDTIILKFGRFLQMPRQEINRALLVSGYAPVYRDTIAPDTDMKPIYFAIDKMLDDHMPFPAIVLDKEWDLVKANDSAKFLLEKIGFTKSVNFIECLYAEDPTTSKIVNWGETVSILLERLKYEIDLIGGSDSLEKREEKLRKHLQKNNIKQNLSYDQVAMNTQFDIDGEILSFFSVVSQFGAILDINVSEFKVELLFPLNEKTKEFYEKEKWR